MLLNLIRIRIPKLLCSLTALAFICASASQLTCLADTTDITHENPGAITVSVPELPGLEISLSGAFDTYEFSAAYDGAEEGGDPHVSYPPTYNIFVQDGSEVSFNMPVVCRWVDGADYEEKEIELNETVTLETGQEIILFIYEDGTFVTEDLAANPLGLQIQISVPDNNTPIQGELFPIDDIKADADITSDETNQTNQTEQTNQPSINDSEPGNMLPIPKTLQLVVDGKEIAIPAYDITGVDFFSLRDLAMVLSGTEAEFDVRWVAESSSIELTSGKAYTPAGGEMQNADPDGEAKTVVERQQDADIQLNGAWISLHGFKIDDRNYFDLETFANTLDFGVFWDDNPDDSKIYIDSSLSYWFPLKGDSSVESEELLTISLSARSSIGYWELTEIDESIVERRDYEKYLDDQYEQLLKDAEESGEDGDEVPILTDEIIPGYTVFLFAGKNPGVTELRFVYTADDPESGESQQTVRAAYRIKVFEDKTVAIIAQDEEEYMGMH